MTHEEAFLAAILESPDDDAPRLIYADWLEDHGDPRAALIRVQCDLERHRRAAFGKPYVLSDGLRRAWQIIALYAREKELLAEFGDIWTPGAIDAVDVSQDIPGLRGHRFRRGFVDLLALPCKAWMSQGRELARLAPLTKIWLSDKAPLSRTANVYTWTERARAISAYVLPVDLLRLMPRTGYFAATQGYRHFESERHARDACSLACLQWARLDRMRRYDQMRA